MNLSPVLEVRRFQRRGEPYAVYYAPDMTICRRFRISGMHLTSDY